MSDDAEALAEVLKAHSVYASGSDLTYEPGDSRRYLDDGCSCGWHGQWGSRFHHQAQALAAHVAAARVEERERWAGELRALVNCWSRGLAMDDVKHHEPVTRLLTQVRALLPENREPTP